MGTWKSNGCPGRGMNGLLGDSTRAKDESLVLDS
jgi:hypothetical protein